MRDNEPRPKPYPKTQSPWIHWQEPDGIGCVIGGLNGFQPPQAPPAAKAEEAKPELHLLDAKEATFEDVIDLFRKLTGREPTAEEIEEARQEWDAD